jgi:hypothetical protein
MAIARTWLSLGLVAFLAGSVGVLAGCSSGSGGCGRSLPLDLPADPDPCLKYCRVWVPPVYRDVPRLVQKCPGTVRKTDEVGYETRYREVMVKPPREHGVCVDGKTCDSTIVQVSPGGWQWQGAGDCWKYCWVPPCYKRCEKVVQEDRICYCVDEPAEFKTVAETVPVGRCREEYVPAQYEVVWVKELYQPGHYEWVASMECDCDSCGPCPPPDDRCRRAVPTGGVAPGAPRTN